MCLSTVYNRGVSSEAILMKNVSKISCSEGEVTLIDLMGRVQTFSGRLLSADLVEGIVVVEEED